MEESKTNANGYEGSALRKYLAPTGDSGSGAFLTGLTNAGVPASILWAPKRYVAKGGITVTAADLIQDKLWLPTEREMRGSPAYSNAIESAENQARLEYYTTWIKYNKFDSYSIPYWLASPRSGSALYFCYCYNVPGFGDADLINGVAPAFCVK
jgi:hypothetical protein